MIDSLFVCCIQDYSKDCPDQAPSEEDLAKRATSPLAEQTSNKKVPYRFTKPAGFEPGRCNAYVPNVGTTLARYLWTVQYLVAQGFYVVVSKLTFKFCGIMNASCLLQI